MPSLKNPLSTAKVSSGLPPPGEVEAAGGGGTVQLLLQVVHVLGKAFGVNSSRKQKLITKQVIFFIHPSINTTKERYFLL